MTVIILVALFLFAILLGKSHPNDLNEYNQFSGLNLDEGCDSNNQGDCIYRQLIYRASFVLFMLYFLLAVGSAFSEKVNRSFWMLKFAFAFCVFFGLWWGSNSFFAGWSHCSLILRMIFMILSCSKTLSLRVAESGKSFIWYSLLGFWRVLSRVLATSTQTIRTVDWVLSSPQSALSLGSPPPSSRCSTKSARVF